MMTRHQSRQEAFCLLFEKSFSDMTLEEIIEGATETRDLQPNEFTMQLAQGTVDHVEELDALIEPKLKNWKLSRISKVSLAILRMAAYELMYVPQVPINVTVDEAVELAKKFGGDESPSFVNGILAKFAGKAAGRTGGEAEADKPAGSAANPEAVSPSPEEPEKTGTEKA